MSYEINAAIICDGCGERYDAPTETRVSCAYATWNAKDWAIKNKWMTINRGRYYTPAHCCHKCADSGVVIPKAKRINKVAP